MTMAATNWRAITSEGKGRLCKMSLLISTRLPEQNEYAMMLSATSLEGVSGSIIVRVDKEQAATYVLPHALASAPRSAGAASVNDNGPKTIHKMGCLVIPTA